MLELRAPNPAVKGYDPQSLSAHSALPCSVLASIDTFWFGWLRSAATDRILTNGSLTIPYLTALCAVKHGIRAGCLHEPVSVG